MARVGGAFSDVRDVIQVRLDKGEKVELVGTQADNAPFRKSRPPPASSAGSSRNTSNTICRPTWPKTSATRWVSPIPIGDPPRTAATKCDWPATRDPTTSPKIALTNAPTMLHQPRRGRPQSNSPAHVGRSRIGPHRRRALDHDRRRRFGLVARRLDRNERTWLCTKRKRQASAAAPA